MRPDPGPGSGLAWQPSLFAPGGAADDGRTGLSFDGLVRHRLGTRSWVDYVPHWLPRHDELFEYLRREGDWRRRRRHMYDRVVAEPRLVASWPVPGAAASGEPDGAVPALPAELERVRTALGHRYGVSFDSILVNLYRDGRDGVAWHRDTVRRRLPEPVVATVSLGARRRFLLRRYGGGPMALQLEPGEGDLVVMGGACQHEYEHTVPKEPARRPTVGGARMSITLRHSHPPLSPAAEPGR